WSGAAYMSDWQNFTIRTSSPQGADGPARLLPDLDELVDRRDGGEQAERVVDHRLGVGGGHPADRVPGQHDVVAQVDRVHDQVGDGDVDRHPGGHDRRHPEVAQHGVEVGPAHRADAVAAAEHDVGGRDADLRHDLDGRAPGHQLDLPPGDGVEQPGVGVRALAVGP